MGRLYDYRKRIATYRTDLDLYASHQNFPWITVWDDHEVGMLRVSFPRLMIISTDEMLTWDLLSADNTFRYELGPCSYSAPRLSN